jgi:hypothetical protein
MAVRKKFARPGIMLRKLHHQLFVDEKLFGVSAVTV